MAAGVDLVKLRLDGAPGKTRAGLYPMLVALIIGFGFCIMWLAACGWLIMQQSPGCVIWGALIGFSTLLYCFYMGYMAFGMIRDSRRLYTLEITDTEAVLYVVDTLFKKKSTQMILLDDVKYAELYPYPDSACVLLHTPYTVMEIPLWPLGSRGMDVIDFLQGRGIAIMNVQFDDKLPV